MNAPSPTSGVQRPCLYPGAGDGTARLGSRLGFSSAFMISCLTILAMLSGPVWAAETVPPEEAEQVRYQAILHNGRAKPFDSFAWETVDRLTGSPEWRGQDSVITVLSIMEHPSEWQEEPLLSVPFVPLQEALGLSPKARHVSYSELLSTRRLMRMLPAVTEKQQRDEKLTMLENETMDLYDRFVTFHTLISKDLSWVSPGSENYPSRWKLHLEVLYNHAAPFRIGRALYLLAALLFFLLAVRGPTGSPRTATTAAGLYGAALAVHAAGILTRVVLGSRPPVSNFYETMLWLPFVGAALAAVFERIYRRGFFGFAGGLLAAALLLLADHLPLDPSISPVVAVLRSNLWLTIHVLTIVGSYAPITLAVVLAHVYGGFYLTRGAQHAALEPLGTYIYRSLQVGVVLLAAGIMLGAVWANASWGRYWGWDPKETWALITLLWYLALLHGRFAGWIKGAGMAAGTIAGFFLLLMTYYGVSFYLVGLHSYAGGNAKPLPALLVAYLAAEVSFVAAVLAKAASLRRA